MVPVLVLLWCLHGVADDGVKCQDDATASQVFELSVFPPDPASCGLTAAKASKIYPAPAEGAVLAMYVCGMTPGTQHEDPEQDL